MTVGQPVLADILYSEEPPADKSHTSPTLTPAAIYLRREKVKNRHNVQLEKGANLLLVRYDMAGRGHFVVRRTDVLPPTEKQPLSMHWANDKKVIPFDVTAGRQTAEWFRF